LAWRLAALNLLVFAPIGVQLPFLSLWYASIGFGAEAIATIQGATPLARFVANLMIPPVADRRGNAPLLLALCALGATAGFAFAGLHRGFWFVFVCIVAGTFAQGPMVALGDSMVLREARRRVVAGERALDYGLIRGIGSGGVLGLMVVGGWLVGLFPPDDMIFVIAAVIGATLLGILALSPRTPPAVGGAAAIPREKIARPGLVALVVLGAALIQASHAMIYTFGSIAFRAQGYSDVVIGLLWAIGVATEVAFFVLMSRRLGGANGAYLFLIIGGASAILRWSLMALPLSTPILFCVQAMHATTFASTHLGSVYALTRLVGETRRAQAQGWISGVNALTYSATAIGCGFLWNAFGSHAYLAMAGVAGAGVALVAVAALDRRKDM
jgi:MFS transporter, PPP family, 3-phenylpropionic acid transporter